MDTTREPFTKPASQLIPGELVSHLDQCRAELAAIAVQNRTSTAPIIAKLKRRIHELERELAVRSLK